MLANSLAAVLGVFCHWSSFATSEGLLPIYFSQRLRVELLVAYPIAAHQVRPDAFLLGSPGVPRGAAMV